MSALPYPTSSSNNIEWSPNFYAAEALFLAFNALDAIFTLLYVSVGVATESNPLLAAAIRISPILFVMVKMTLAIIAVTILHALRQSRGAQRVMVFGALTYAIVTGWHLMHVHIGAVALASL